MVMQVPSLHAEERERIGELRYGKTFGFIPTS